MLAIFGVIFSVFIVFYFFYTYIIYSYNFVILVESLKIMNNWRSSSSFAITFYDFAKNFVLKFHFSVTFVAKVGFKLFYFGSF